MMSEYTPDTWLWLAVALCLAFMYLRERKSRRTLGQHVASWQGFAHAAAEAAVDAGADACGDCGHAVLFHTMYGGSYQWRATERSCLHKDCACATPREYAVAEGGG